MTVYWPNGSRSDVVPPRPGVASSGFRASSEYGMRVNPVDGGYRLHAGIDLIGWTTILSPVDGRVTFAGWNGGYGNLVEITADNGDRFRMAHNRSINVVYGQRVKARQAVAIMGTTGNSTGVHCHFEVYPKGSATINPRDYMARQPVPGPSGGGSTPIPTPEEDDDMTRNTGIYTQRASDKKWVYMIFNYGSSIGHEYGSGSSTPMPGDYNNAIARAFDTPSFAKVTEGHYNVIKKSLRNVVYVDMDDADVKAITDAIASIDLDPSDVQRAVTA